MNIFKFSAPLSLRGRLGLIGLIAMLLALLPSGLLIRSYAQELSLVAREAQGLPVNEAWHHVLSSLQAHRQLAAEGLSTRPEARQQWPVARQALKAALTSLEQAWATLPTSSATPADVSQSLAQELERLYADLDAGKLDVAKLLARQQAISAQVFRAIADFNGDAGLLLDTDAANHAAIVAGLQAAPQVEDALSELGSIARAAAVDDVAGVTAALTRYREHSDLMLQQMQAAERAGGALGQTLAPLVQQARAQRKLVDDTMQAAAQDVNYPLEQLAAGFGGAAKLQAELSSQVLAGLKTALNERSEQAEFRRNLLLVLMPLMLAMLGLMLLRAIRQLLEPVAQMVEITERIAVGDLSQPIPQGRQDELGRVLQAMDHMQQRLRRLVEQIHSGAGHIRQAAQEIADGNQDLSQRTETAAAHLQQTSSSVDLLDQAVQHSSRAAAEATALARSASGMASNGGEVVEQVVNTMAAIHESSQRIADITGVIDGIAFQTNILALNAAVEAARAGEQGRGFAVVASEVRALAGRSAEAAKEIKQLIQRSVERVESGSELATNAGSAMRQIVGQVQQVTEVMLGMDGQARAQAGQTRELGRAVRSIDNMTQQNAALVEQSATAAKLLRSQAESMDLSAQAFKL
ncbi:methyl-accepting chemotaxis protein [Paucibacter sp. AS339]|uniref:methyl-accepting chemotaxis protein n=1 Tax=Paucibacter hankyongi TaxID=3133434 RepID=UPI0030A71FD3